MALRSMGWDVNAGDPAGAAFVPRSQHLSAEKLDEALGTTRCSAPKAMVLCSGDYRRGLLPVLCNRRVSR